MTAVEVIHQQHQELLAKLNNLNDAVTRLDSRERIYSAIDDILAYTRFHFSTEERLMSDTGFGDIDWHREKHQQLIEDAIKLKDKLNLVGEEMFTDWFMHWPFGRVLAHIQYADRQFEDHINRHTPET